MCKQTLPPTRALGVVRALVYMWTKQGPSPNVLPCQAGVLRGVTWDVKPGKRRSLRESGGHARRTSRHNVSWV